MKKNIALIVISIFCGMTAVAQPSATLEWAKQLGGTSADNSLSVAVDNLGNVYTTGDFRGTSDFDPGPGTFNLTAIGIRDIFISKLDADGNFVWAVQLAGEDNEYSRAIAVDAAGNVYTTGSFLDTVDFDPGPGTYNLIAMPGHENVFISKLDADGNFVWAKQIGDPVGLPGVHWNYGRAIAVDATGNVYTTGNFFSTSDFDPGAATYNLTSAGNDDIFISKLDAAGDFVWAKRMGGIGGDKGISIVVDALGNVYTTGNFQETSDFDPGGGSFNLTSDGWDDIFISKLDVGGNFVWAKQFAGMSNNYGFAIAVDENENVYSTGNFNGTTDFDPGTAIYNLTANGNPDIYISKLNAAGDFAWAKRIGANSYSGTEGGYGITVVDGFVYTVGDFGNAADFDPGPGEHWLTSTGGDDVFICKLDTLGNFVWARNYGGTTDSDMGLSIAVDANGFVYTSGYFQNTADFDPSSRTFELTSTGNTDVFVHKMSQCISTDSTLTLTACDSISINGITYDSSGYYSQILINAQGCDSTIYLNLTIDTSASITAQPSSYSKCVGNNVTFTMDATGTALHFAWQKDGIPLAGDTTNTLAFNNIQPSDDAIYTCQVSNMCGSITTDDAILKVVVLTLDAGTGSAFCNDTAVQFDAIAVSNYSAESGTISYSWSPSTGLSDTAIANPVAQPNTNTLYSLSIFDQLGCYATDTISLISITPLSMVSQPDSIQNICINDGVILNVTISGTWPFTFLWKKDGDTIPGADMPNYSIGSTAISDEGVYYCEVTNYCNTVNTDSILMKIIDVTAIACDDVRICNGNSTTISASGGTNHATESGTLTYSWMPTTGLSTANADTTDASPVITTNYIVQITDQLGCSETDDVIVNVANVFQDEEICLVSVDPDVGKNKIMWEKTNGMGTEYYVIYKEDGTNNYTQIGNVAADQPSEYIDYFSVPESHGDKYKLTALDTCGNESELSFFHKTINLTIAAAGSTMGLNWDDYVDESGNYTPYRYYIYRGLQTNNMELIDSVSGSFNSYNDVGVFDVYYYMIGVKKDGGCNVSKTTDFMAFSNKKDNEEFIIGMQDYAFDANLTIYPNPFTSQTTISFGKPIPEYRILITDVTGKVVFEDKNASGDKYVLQRRNIENGVYFLEISSEKGRVVRKLIVE